MREQEVKYFWLAFAASFFVLACLVLSAAFLTVPYSPQKQQEYYSEPIYLPKEEDALTVLVVGVKEDHAPQSFMLVRFSPETGRIPILTITGKTAVANGVLTEIYEQLGAEKAAEHLGEEFGIKIDRYAVVQINALEKMVRLVGDVEYSLPYNITYKKGDMEFEISKGNHVMNSVQICEIASCENVPGGELEHCRIISELAAAAINQHLTLACSQRAEPLFRAMVNLMDTNVDYMDYESHRKALVFMAELKEKPAWVLTLSGSFNYAQNTFSVDNACRSRIEAVYGTTKT
ncbi:MAG: LCP family protein [Oscillospiraceae bacterium]|nr:LCP family protein [Oscillospiraceae bacterium]